LSETLFESQFYLANIRYW